MGAFIHPFTDWGFKYLFGREESKDILIEFLNDLLQGERVITDIRYHNLINMNKLQQLSFKDQKAIFSRLEKLASQANLSQAEREKYETEWMIYNDYFNTIESAERKAAKEAGTHFHLIAQVTGLPIEEVESL